VATGARVGPRRPAGRLYLACRYVPFVLAGTLAATRGCCGSARAAPSSPGQGPAGGPSSRPRSSPNSAMTGGGASYPLGEALHTHRGTRHRWARATTGTSPGPYRGGRGTRGRTIFGVNASVSAPREWLRCQPVVPHISSRILPFSALSARSYCVAIVWSPPVAGPSSGPTAPPKPVR